MEQVTWKSNLSKLVRGEHLTAEETEWFVDDLMRGNADPAASACAVHERSVDVGDSIPMIYCGFPN